MTTWGEARHFLNQFSEFSEIESDNKYPLTDNPPNFAHYILRFPSPYSFVDFGTRVDFEAQSGVVVAIKLWDDIGGHMFGLDKLYREYGSPDRIFIVPEQCYAWCDTNIYFLYDHQRFMSVNLVESTKNDSEISLCVFYQSRLGYISMWSPDVNIDIDAYEKNNPKFIPFAQVTNLTIDEFFKQLSKEGKACVKASPDLWK